MSGIALLGILTVLFGMGIYVSVAMGLGGLALVTIFGDRPVWDIFGYVPLEHHNLLYAGCAAALRPHGGGAAAIRCHGGNVFDVVEMAEPLAGRAPA
jgi:hypothetical protein